LHGKAANTQQAAMQLDQLLATKNRINIIADW
jgi:hypothetical protein